MGARFISETRRYGPEAAGLAMLFLVVACGWLQGRGVFEAVDHALMQATGDARSGGGSLLTPFAIALSRVADVSGRLLMLGVLALAMMWRGLGRQWLWLAAVSLIAMLLNTALKHLFAAARPEILAHLDPTMTYSFPSGHASGNAVFLGALAMLWPSRAGSAVALALIGMIGISRVWLGVHWPSDVVCGWIEGAAILLLARRWQPARSPA
ncbi:MAG: phosphatase PAP2 family protein [Sphingobium sp.]|jgi:membrane-associated phospholipid phosphatase|nr:phosphatase PAP2 family protein [Sphingobium sp.]